MRHEECLAQMQDEIRQDAEDWNIPGPRIEVCVAKQETLLNALFGS
jgi:hypothetical protein